MVFGPMVTATDEFAAQREAYTRRFETRRSHLVEQRREGVVVVSIDDHNIPNLLVNFLDQVQPGETAAYYDGIFSLP